MKVPTLVRDRLNPPPAPPPPPVPIGHQHWFIVDITDYRAGYKSAMCNDCGARWSEIPHWRLATRRT